MKSFLRETQHTILITTFVITMVALSLQPAVPAYAAWPLNCATALNIAVSPDQCEALKSIYINTNGDAWTENTNWGTDTDVNNWFGLQRTGSEISQIILNANNLVGNFSPVDLHALTGLQSLYLSDNKLRGRIPTNWNTLTNLQSISLSNNRLIGSIPTNWNTLTNLQYLNLSNNQLSESIPDNLGTLTQLEFLSLSNNQLNSIVPDLQQTILTNIGLGLCGGANVIVLSGTAAIDTYAETKDVTGWTAAGGCPDITPPPNNDLRSSPKVITLDYTDTLDTSSATSSVDDPSINNCGIDKGFGTVWYTYTPTTNTAIAIDTLDSNYNTFIAVWIDTGSTLSLITCNDNSSDNEQSQLTIRLQQNATYYIEVGVPR